MKTTIIIASIVIMAFSCAKQSVEPTRPSSEEINAQYKRKIGYATFWFHSTCNCGYVSVTFDKISSTGNALYSASAPDCNNLPAEGVKFYLDADTEYNYYAESSLPEGQHKVWRGKVTVSEGECQVIELINK